MVLSRASILVERSHACAELVALQILQGDPELIEWVECVEP